MQHSHRQPSSFTCLDRSTGTPMSDRGKITSAILLPGIARDINPSPSLQPCIIRILTLQKGSENTAPDVGSHMHPRNKSKLAGATFKHKGQ